MKKLIIFGFLLLVIMTFVSSVVYPAPFVQCQPEPIQCPSGYDLTDNMNMQAFYNNGNKISASTIITDTCGKAHTCIKVISPPPKSFEMGNIQLNLESKMGSSVGTTSIATEDFALRQELDNPLELKRIEDCNKSKGCYNEKLCFLTGDVINLTYCFEGQFFNQRSWGNLCDFDYQCLEGFCYEGRCYRGGREVHIDSLQNNLNKLEERIDSLEGDSVIKEKEIKITGAVVSDVNESWIKKVWKNIFGKIFG